MTEAEKDVTPVTCHGCGNTFRGRKALASHKEEECKGKLESRKIECSCWKGPCEYHEGDSW